MNGPPLSLAFAGAVGEYGANEGASRWFALSFPAKWNTLDASQNCRRIAVGIEAHTKTAAEQILYNGKLLCEARELLKADQEFGRWREKRLPWLDRKMAHRWMEAWGNGGENLLGHNVTPTSVYLLTAPSVPESAREEALERAESGEKLTVKATEEIVARHKAELAAMEERAVHPHVELQPECGGRLRGNYCEIILQCHSRRDAGTPPDRLRRALKGEVEAGLALGIPGRQSAIQGK